MSTIKKLRTRISSAHVIAMIALFVALSGSSYAAVTTIHASQIRNNSIPGSKIKAGSIPATKLKNGSIGGNKLKNNTVGRAKLRTDALNPIAGGGNLVNAQGQTDDESSSSGASGSRGPQGPAGPRGVTGAQGAKGDTGAPGANGAQGASGNDAGLVQIPAIATLDATGAGTATATCPAAHPAVLGGNYTGAGIRTATATMTDSSYSVTVSGGAALGSLTVYAVCGGIPTP
jgi:Collagen triple helix repeat (20 copies)